MAQHETLWEFPMPGKRDTKLMLTRKLVAGHEQVELTYWKLVPKYVNGPREWIRTSGVMFAREDFDTDLFIAFQNLKNLPRLDVKE